MVTCSVLALHVQLGTTVLDRRKVNVRSALPGNRRHRLLLRQLIHAYFAQLENILRQLVARVLNVPRATMYPNRDQTVTLNARSVMWERVSLQLEVVHVIFVPLVNSPLPQRFQIVKTVRKDLQRLREILPRMVPQAAPRQITVSRIAVLMVRDHGQASCYCRHAKLVPQANMQTWRGWRSAKIACLV